MVGIFDPRLAVMSSHVQSLHLIPASCFALRSPAPIADWGRSELLVPASVLHKLLIKQTFDRKRPCYARQCCSFIHSLYIFMQVLLSQHWLQFLNVVLHEIPRIKWRQAWFEISKVDTSSTVSSPRCKRRGVAGRGDGCRRLWSCGSGGGMMSMASVDSCTMAQRGSSHSTACFLGRLFVTGNRGRRGQGRWVGGRCVCLRGQ